MSAQDRVRWDDIYTQRANRPYPNPDPLLFEYTPPVKEGEPRRALDLAAGLGQNGLWLAGQGYHTDIMDISRVALQWARAEMTMRNIRNVNLLQIDLDDVQLEEAEYDVICVFRYLKRSLFPMLRTAVRPGGRVIYETFNLNYIYVVPGFNKDFLLEPGELRAYFGDWQIIADIEANHISQLVARKL